MHTYSCQDVKIFKTTLFSIIKKNARLYPEMQAYLRTYQPPLLAVWGKNDPSFIPAGAEAFKKDVPNAVIKFVDSGHFALESHHNAIAEFIKDFMQCVKG